jgi:hypothetical protein
VVSTHSVIKDSIGLSEDELAFAMMGMPLPAFTFSDVTLFAALAIAGGLPKRIMNGCHGF